MLIHTVTSKAQFTGVAINIAYLAYPGIKETRERYEVISILGSKHLKHLLEEVDARAHRLTFMPIRTTLQNGS